MWVTRLISVTFVTASQPKDPLDEKQEDGIRIMISSFAFDYNYLFTWNGDKLILGKNLYKRDTRTKQQKIHQIFRL